MKPVTIDLPSVLIPNHPLDLVAAGSNLIWENKRKTVTLSLKHQSNQPARILFQTPIQDLHPILDLDQSHLDTKILLRYHAQQGNQNSLSSGHLRHLGLEGLLRKIHLDEECLIRCRENL
jgi:hypothetical protein